MKTEKYEKKFRPNWKQRNPYLANPNKVTREFLQYLFYLQNRGLRPRRISRLTKVAPYVTDYIFRKRRKV